MPSHSDNLLSTKEMFPQHPIVDFDIFLNPPGVVFYDTRGLRIPFPITLPNEIKSRLHELKQEEPALDQLQTFIKIQTLKDEIFEYLNTLNLRVMKRLNKMLEFEIQEYCPNQILINKLEKSIAEFKEFCTPKKIEEYSDSDSAPEPNPPENTGMATGEPEELKTGEAPHDKLIYAYDHVDIHAKIAFKKLIKTWYATGKSVPKRDFLHTKSASVKQFFSGTGKGIHRRTLGRIIKKDSEIQGNKNAAYYPEFPGGFDVKGFIDELEKRP